MTFIKNKTTQRRKTLEDQGQWKDLWEEANKTAQTKDQQIADLERQLADLRTSNETAAMKTSALSAIIKSGAINAEQMLQLVQSKLKRLMTAASRCLNGGIEARHQCLSGQAEKPWFWLRASFQTE